MNSKDSRFWPEVINQFKEEMRILHDQGIVPSSKEISNMLSKIVKARRAQMKQIIPDAPETDEGKGS